MTNSVTKRKQTAKESEAALLAELAIPQKLDAWNALVEEVRLPTVMAAAMITMRPELLRAAQPRALTEEEAARVYHALAVLIETNAALMTHAQRLARMHEHWGSAFGQLRSLGDRIIDFANFTPYEDEGQ